MYVQCSFVGKDCGSPPSINNANMTANISTFGSIITYTCLEGFIASQMQTQQAVKCEGDGIWTPLGDIAAIIDCFNETGTYMFFYDW